MMTTTLDLRALEQIAEFLADLHQDHVHVTDTHRAIADCPCEVAYRYRQVREEVKRLRGKSLREQLREQYPTLQEGLDFARSCFPEEGDS